MNAQFPLPLTATSSCEAPLAADPQVIVDRILAAAGPKPDEFDWSTDDSVIVGTQLAIAVYHNRNDDIVIRQDGRGADDDSFVYVGREALPRLIRALQDIEAGD